MVQSYLLMRTFEFYLDELKVPEYVSSEVP